MKALGLRTFRDRVTWASIDGTTRLNARVSGHGTLTIPSGERGDELVWVRQEITALVAQEQPDSVVIGPAEGSTVSSALIERAHVDALILATLSELKVPATAKKSATIRASFGAKTKLQLAATLKAVPALAAIKPNSSWREPVIAAVSDLPA